METQLTAELDAWIALQEHLVQMRENSTPHVKAVSSLVERLGLLGPRVESLEEFVRQFDSDATKFSEALKDEVQVLVSERISEVHELTIEAFGESVSECQNKVDAIVEEIEYSGAYLASFVDDSLGLVEESVASLVDTVRDSFEAIRSKILEQYDIAHQADVALNKYVDNVEEMLDELQHSVLSTTEDAMSQIGQAFERLSASVNLLADNIESASIGLTESAAAIDGAKDIIASPL